MSSGSLALMTMLARKPMTWAVFTSMVPRLTSLIVAPTRATASATLATGTSGVLGSAGTWGG
jgi:hypothetical protein